MLFLSVDVMSFDLMFRDGPAMYEAASLFGAGRTTTEESEAEGASVSGASITAPADTEFDEASVPGAKINDPADTEVREATESGANIDAPAETEAEADKAGSTWGGGRTKAMNTVVIPGAAAVAAYAAQSYLGSDGTASLWSKALSGLSSAFSVAKAESPATTYGQPGSKWSISSGSAWLDQSVLNDAVGNSTAGNGKSFNDTMYDIKHDVSQAWL